MAEIKNNKIYDVIVSDLKIIRDERGAVMRMLRRDDPIFKQFGEIYFSKILPGAVKAWKLHKNMESNLAALTGIVKLVLYDNRSNSKTKGVIQEITLSQENYKLITAPPLIWFGFAALGNQPAILANCATMPHNDSEVEKLDAFNNNIPYDWKTAIS